MKVDGWASHNSTGKTYADETLQLQTRAIFREKEENSERKPRAERLLLGATEDPSLPGFGI